MKKLKVFSPYNNKLIKEIPMVGAKEVEEALDVAPEVGVDNDRLVTDHAPHAAASLDLLSRQTDGDTALERFEARCGGFFGTVQILELPNGKLLLDLGDR